MGRLWESQERILPSECCPSRLKMKDSLSRPDSSGVSTRSARTGGMRMMMMMMMMMMNRYTCR
jgi:hypothetical protein